MPLSRPQHSSERSLDRRVPETTRPAVLEMLRALDESVLDLSSLDLPPAACPGSIR